MYIKAIKTTIFREGDDLEQFIVRHIRRVREKAIIVVTSKIVALAERRTVIVKSKQEKIKLIKAESDFAVETKYVWLTIKDGMLMASAGIDESNADGKLILLPKDSYEAAATLRKKLQKRFGVKKLGVIITDSRTMPMRAGVTGVALGYAGIRGLRDYRGTPDIYGRKFVFSTSNIPDSLATAAVVEMGEGKERQPLAVIQDAPVVYANALNKNEVRIDPKDDMYLPFLLPRRKNKS